MDFLHYKNKIFRNKSTKKNFSENKNPIPKYLDISTKTEAAFPQVAKFENNSFEHYRSRQENRFYLNEKDIENIKNSFLQCSEFNRSGKKIKALTDISNK